MTRTEFVQGMALLQSAIGKSMTDAQVAAWFAMLRDLTPDQLRQGIVETLREHQYAGFPPIGAILKNSGAERSVDDEALLAWAEVRSAIRKYGYTDSMDFGATVNATVRQLGGWQQITETPSEQMQWVEKRFIEHYRSVSSMPAIPEGEGRHLVGWIEIQNRGTPGAEFPLISCGQRETRRIGVSAAAEFQVNFELE